MRDRDQRLRNEVEHPERYEEFCDGLAAQGINVVDLADQRPEANPRNGKLRHVLRALNR